MLDNGKGFGVMNERDVEEELSFFSEGGNVEDHLRRQCGVVEKDILNRCENLHTHLSETLKRLYLLLLRHHGIRGNDSSLPANTVPVGYQRFTESNKYTETGKVTLFFEEKKLFSPLFVDPPFGKSLLSALAGEVTHKMRECLSLLSVEVLQRKGEAIGDDTSRLIDYSASRMKEMLEKLSLDFTKNGDGIGVAPLVERLLDLPSARLALFETVTEDIFEILKRENLECACVQRDPHTFSATLKEYEETNLELLPDENFAITINYFGEEELFQQRERYDRIFDEVNEGIRELLSHLHKKEGTDKRPLSGDNRNASLDDLFVSCRRLLEKRTFFAKARPKERFYELCLKRHNLERMTDPHLIGQGLLVEAAFTTISSRRDTFKKMELLFEELKERRTADTTIFSSFSLILPGNLSDDRSGTL